MKYIFEDCTLKTDTEKNRKLYEKLPVITDECTCDGCTNFMLAIKYFPKEVKLFFENLGIDIRKASEIIAWSSENEGRSLFYGGFYHLCGRIEITDSKSDNNPEMIGFHTLAEGYSVWFTEDISLAEDCLDEEAVQMEIGFHGVPWILDHENPY